MITYVLGGEKLTINTNQVAYIVEHKDGVGDVFMTNGDRFTLQPDDLQGLKKHI